MVRDIYYTAIINKIPIELEGSANQWRLYQPDMEKLTYKTGSYSKYMSRDRIKLRDEPFMQQIGVNTSVPGF